MIKLHQVSKLYNNAIPALAEINLNIAKGEFVFITGPSGAGKTTLLKIIFSSVRPTSGEIIVNGINIARISDSAIPFFRRKIGVVYQDFKLIEDDSHQSGKFAGFPPKAPEEYTRYTGIVWQ